MNINTSSSTRVQVKDSTKVNKTGDIMTLFLTFAKTVTSPLMYNTDNGSTTVLHLINTAATTHHTGGGLGAR